MTRVAVVGHVEWVQFVSVPRFPVPGEILHAQDDFSRAGGGGAVAAVVLAQLEAEVDFFTALGDDELGRAAMENLSARGIRMQRALRDQPTRRAVTLLDDQHERTIVTIGERLAPSGADALAWDQLAGADGVYFTAGDGDALARARRARVLVATPRARVALASDGPVVDAIVYSGHDDVEVQWARGISHRARLYVATEGADGGSWWGESSGRWAATPLPGPPRDAYGSGDSFAAGFTFGLATGRSVLEAAQLGARCGAQALTRVGGP